jgi:hypothetical protein
MEDGMLNRRIVGGVAVIGALALAACSNFGGGPAEYSITNDTGVGATAGSGASSSTSGTQDKARGTGGTTGRGGGSIANTPAPAGPGEKEDQRGNTPPGVSRDGQGPLGGAIVDPTGAATQAPAR